MIDFLGQILIWFFTDIPGVGDAMAFYIAISLIGAAVIIAWHYHRKHHSPLLEAIRERNSLISERIGGSRSPSSEAREAFAAAYFEIDEKMMEAPRDEVFGLPRAWEEYRETIVDPDAEILKNSVRPEHFFLGLGEQHRALGWFANIAIAVGLLFTFLGIIAALSTLDLSGGPDRMQEQLNDLMQVAGAKFWASVGGILASIILRSVDYRFAKRVNEGLGTLCDLIEHGMAYLPPQRVASDQLKQLEEQTPALRGFSEQLAVVLEAALEKQFTPMVSSLGMIQEGIDRISGDGGEAVKKAVTERAGAEMAGLADAIGTMTLSLGTMAERLEKQTSSADKQIEDAVRRFGQASEEMREAFGELNKNFAAVADRMRSDGEAASEQARRRMEELNENFAALAARMKADNEAASTEARGQMNELIANLGANLDEMRERMTASAQQFGEATTGAARQAAEAGQTAFQESFTQFVTRFQETSQPLLEEMQKASTSIGTAANSLDGSNRAMGDYTRGIESVAARSSDIAASLATVANDVREATEPVRQSASSMEKALTAMSRAIENDARNAETTRQEMREMSESTREELRQMSQSTRGELREISGALTATAQAAENAWADYRARFNEVDKSLGEALNLLSEAAGSHAKNLNDRVSQVDEALAKGVSQLAAALRPLESLSDTVEDLSATLMNSQSEAAE